MIYGFRNRVISCLIIFYAFQPGCNPTDVTILESRIADTQLSTEGSTERSTETTDIDDTSSATSVGDTSSVTDIGDTSSLSDTGDTGTTERPFDFPYILGVDVSLIQQDEAAGAIYLDEGVQKDIFEILTEHRFNFAKLWILVDPAAPGGYAETFNEAFGDRDHVLSMATRIKAAGMGLMVSFHCSDKGGDAETQVKPAAWEGHDMATLEQDMYTHTHDTMQALVDNGTRPDLVQVGNEIAIGIVLPEGSIDTPENFAALLSAGIQGIRDVDDTIPVALHHPRGRSNDEMIAWLDVLSAQGVDFDIIGASTWAENAPGQYLSNFTDLSDRYPGYPFLSLLHSADDIEVIHDVMPQLPDNRGMGAFLYGPTRAQGTENAVFDNEGTDWDTATGGLGGTYRTNGYIDLYPQIAERVGL